MKGLIVNIYKDGSDCSNGGLSSKTNRCIIVNENMPKIFQVSKECPAVKIVKRDLFNGTYLTAYPINEDGTIDRNCMFGGTFVYSSDSRFREISAYPVPLHDRKE
jgi:hypothetical protein